MTRGTMNLFIEFDAGLKKGIVAPVYLFYGEEAYLRDLALVRLKEFFEQGNPNGLDVDVIEGETADPVDVAVRAETLPFFAARRLVIVKSPSFFKTARRGGKRARVRRLSHPEGKRRCWNILKIRLHQPVWFLAPGSRSIKESGSFRL